MVVHVEAKTSGSRSHHAGESLVPFSPSTMKQLCAKHLLSLPSPNGGFKKRWFSYHEPSGEFKLRRTYYPLPCNPRRGARPCYAAMLSACNMSSAFTQHVPHCPPGPPWLSESPWSPSPASLWVLSKANPGRMLSRAFAGEITLCSSEASRIQKDPGSNLQP